jgi:imidazolonepropionase-like amidohydrolase
MHRVIELSQKAYAEFRKRGVRVVIGGDYGFAWAPQGTNARDLVHFVELFGYTPGEALQCATRVGGELMGMGGELGLVKEGAIADLLLVSGDPLKNLKLLQDKENLVVIMKDGALYKDASAGLRRQAHIAAE